MNRRSLAFAACAVGVGGLTLARHVETGGAKVTQLSRRDIVEKLDGKDARVTVEEVAIEPGHRKGHGPGGGRQERLTGRLPGTGRRRSITWPGPPTSPGIRRPSIALARRSRLPPPSRRGNG
jgi:hypothetical protein